MTFRVIKGCRRSPAEQRYIWSMMRIWNSLSLERRESARQLIDAIAEDPAEARALFDLVIREQTPQGLNMRTGIPLARLYGMRREFYEQFRI